MCCLRRRYTKTPDNNDNGNLNSFTIHNEENKNIKDRVQMNELKSKRKSEVYQDIKEVFLRSNKETTKFNTATQTSDTLGDNVTSTPSSPTNFAFNDAMRSSGRLSSCYSCSKSIDDDDMVNIFLNKSWTDNDANEVKFEVVGKSVNQANKAKRFQIDDNITEIDDNSTTSTEKPDNEADIATISIPIRHNSILRKSEIFIMVNEDSTLQVVNGSDDVFK